METRFCLDALPVPGLLVRDGQAIEANSAARALLGEDFAATWLGLTGLLGPNGATQGSRRVELPMARQVLDLEIALGATAADGGRLVLLRDVGAEGAARRRLERRLDFERLLTRSSADLMRSDEARLDEAIEQVLGNVGRFFAVDRAYVFRIDDAAGTQSNTHEWTAPGISHESANLQGVPLDTFPWLLAELRRDEVFSYALLDDLPETAHNERTEFEREGIQSILIVPLWSAGALRGFIGFDAVRSRVDWDESYEVGLRLLAQMLASALDAREMSRQLRRQAMHDAVTGLPNRLYLRDRFSAATRWSPDSLVAVVDVDDFKLVNDRFGHGAGDSVLRELGRRLVDTLGPEAVVARVGGDEFVVVDPRSREPGARVAARLVEAAERPFELAGGVHRVGISVGVVHGVDGRAGLDALLDRADAAMYRAKAAGKNRWAMAEADAVDVLVD